MSTERKTILEMLSQGKIKVEDAERLLDAIGGRSGEGSAPSSGPGKKSPKYLIVNVRDVTENPDNPTRVNVRVPLQMLRAGVKLAALIPAVAKSKINEALEDKGMHLDFDNLKPENLSEIIDAMEDMTVDVESEDGKETVKVYCE